MLALLAALLLSQPAQAEFRKAENTRESLQELARRCIVQAKNEKKPLQLLVGKLHQARYFDEKPTTCDFKQTGEEVCPTYDWYPKQFAGYLTHTNLFERKQMLLIRLKDFYEQEMKQLSFNIGRFYAFCAEQTRPMVGKRPAEFTIYNYFTIYEIAEASE